MARSGTRKLIGVLWAGGLLSLVAQVFGPGYLASEEALSLHQPAWNNYEWVVHHIRDHLECPASCRSAHAREKGRR